MLPGSRNGIRCLMNGTVSCATASRRYIRREVRALTEDEKPHLMFRFPIRSLHGQAVQNKLGRNEPFANSRKNGMPRLMSCIAAALCAAVSAAIRAALSIAGRCNTRPTASP